MDISGEVPSQDDVDAIVKLVEFLEERFRIEVTDDERIPEHFESIDALSAFVQQKRGA